MSKILHSTKFIKHVINQKNKFNYLKNGGGYMANTKIFTEKNFFDDLISFLETEEQKEKESKTKDDIKEDIKEEKQQSTISPKEILEQEYESALNEFNLKLASRIKEKLDKLSVEPQSEIDEHLSKGDEEFRNSLFNLKNKTKDEAKEEIFSRIQNEDYLKELIDFVVGIIQNA